MIQNSSTDGDVYSPMKAENTVKQTEGTEDRQT